MTGPLRAERVILALLAFSACIVGFWAQLAPKSFYDDFPGFGHHWVSVDGPYNEHLVRDVGGLNLALAVVTLAALIYLAPRMVRTAAFAWLVYSVPHFLYHLNHLGAYNGSDKAGNVVSLALTIVMPIVLIFLSATGARAASPAPLPR